MNDTGAGVTPKDALDEIRMLLGYEPGKGACEDCCAVWTAWTEQVGKAQDDETKLAALAQMGLNDTHLDSETFKDGWNNEDSWCIFDLTLARDTAVLGLLKEESVLAWGPGHATGVAHPADWEDCENCTRWKTRRENLRERANLAGIDIKRIIGEDDDPGWYLRQRIEHAELEAEKSEDETKAPFLPVEAASAVARGQAEEILEKTGKTGFVCYLYGDSLILAQDTKAKAAGTHDYEGRGVEITPDGKMSLDPDWGYKEGEGMETSIEFNAGQAANWLQGGPRAAIPA